MTVEKTAAVGDYNDLRVHEVLENPESHAVVAMRIEAVWGTHRGSGEPAIWDRSIFVGGSRRRAR